MLKKIKSYIYKVYFFVGKNIYWLFFKYLFFKPRVMTPEDTIKLIIDKQLSVSRFGEGEYKLMCKKGKIGFQDANDDLSDRLLRVFQTRNDKLLICSYNFSLKRPMNTKSGIWLKNYVFIYYKYLNFFDKNYLYGDAEITRFYQPDCYNYTDFDYLENHYIPLLKNIWQNRRVLIVEGNETKLGVGNNLFDNATNIRRIECPARNAFCSYDKILSSILEMKEASELVLIALGPTASVLVADLSTNYNVRSIDIGHIDVVYMWFLNRVTQKAHISGKYVNETNGDSNVSMIFSDNGDNWKSEIIKVIKND